MESRESCFWDVWFGNFLHFWWNWSEECKWEKETSRAHRCVPHNSNPKSPMTWPVHSPWPLHSLFVTSRHIIIWSLYCQTGRYWVKMRYFHSCTTLVAHVWELFSYFKKGLFWSNCMHITTILVDSFMGYLLLRLPLLVVPLFQHRAQKPDTTLVWLMWCCTMLVGGRVVKMKHHMDKVRPPLDKGHLYVAS